MADPAGEPPACGICERSMLSGERTRTYVTRDRDQREVCDLCVVRAETEGWVALELSSAQVPERPERRGRMRRFFDRSREGATPGGGSGEVDETDDEEKDPPPRIKAPRAKRRSEPSAAPAEGDQPPRRRSVPQNPEQRIRRAFESFNASPHRRTVRGLIRSLGGPYVAAATTNDSPGDVRITVAWELSWYQYEVDLTSIGDEPVRELGRGEELSQLAEADRAWNGHAAEDGELRTGLIGSEDA